MTLKEIHAMFEPGTKWEAINTYRDGANGTRTVVKRLTTQLVFSTDNDPRFWMTLPKAAQVIEARDGFLAYNLFSSEDEVKYRKPGALAAIVTLTRVS